MGINSGIPIDDPERDFTDVFARIAFAIERAGADHLGDLDSLHLDLIRIVALVPKERRRLQTSEIDRIGKNQL